jgi:ribosomal protein L14
MTKLTVKTEFEVTTTNTSKIFAKVGDIIIVTNKDAEHYNVLKVNNTRITSRWMRKSWINAKCN